MNKWDAMLSFVIEKIRDRSTDLPLLAERAKVSIWWLYRIRTKHDVVDPGFTKIGRCYSILSGKRPPTKEQK